MLFNVLNQEWFTAMLVVCILCVFILSIVRLRAKVCDQVSGLQRKSRLFSSSERQFFENLADALDYDFYIFAKVNVLELIDRGPKMSKSRFNALSKLLKNEHFDYVVCKKKDLSVSAVIQLECFDRRMSRASKQKRDALIAEVCKASKLKLFYFDTRQDYLGMDIRRLITGSSKCVSPTSEDARQLKRAEVSDTVESHSMVTENVGQNSCPECHSEMVTKIAVKGKHIGERFLMCRKYPYCEYRVLLNDPNVVNILSVGPQASEPRRGFSDWSG